MICPMLALNGIDFTGTGHILFPIFSGGGGKKANGRQGSRYFSPVVFVFGITFWGQSKVICLSIGPKGSFEMWGRAGVSLSHSLPGAFS